MATFGPAAMSAREAEVLGALGEHLTNAQIAQRLHISTNKVDRSASCSSDADHEIASCRSHLYRHF